MIIVFYICNVMEKKVIKAIIQFLVKGEPLPDLTGYIKSIDDILEICENHSELFITYGVTVDGDFDISEFPLNIYYQNKNSMLSFCQKAELIDVIDMGRDELINELDLQTFADILDKPENRDMLDEIYDRTYEWIDGNSWEMARSTDISKMYYSDSNLKEVITNSEIPKEKQVELFNLIKANKSDLEIVDEIPEYEEEKTIIKSDLFRYEEESEYFEGSTYKTLKNIDNTYDGGLIKYYLSSWYLRNNKNSAFHKFDIFQEVDTNYLCDIVIENSKIYNKYQIGKDVVVIHT